MEKLRGSAVEWTKGRWLHRPLNNNPFSRFLPLILPCATRTAGRRLPTALLSRFRQLTVKLTQNRFLWLVPMRCGLAADHTFYRQASVWPAALSCCLALFAA